MLESEIADVWVGRFASQAAHDAYLEETYSETDEDSPISQFAADQGSWFYDHDFMEVKYLDEARDMLHLLEGFNGGQDYSAQVAAAVEWGKGWNTAMVVFRHEIESPRSAQGEGYEVEYAGQYVCQF